MATCQCRRQNATAFLREHPDVTQGILQQIQVELGSDQVASARLLPVAAEEAATSNGKAEVAAEALASAEADA